MTPAYDIVDGMWRYTGHESIRFTSEQDAKAGLQLAAALIGQEMVKEMRNRRAAERGKVAHG